MDAKIKQLESATFLGRRFTRQQLWEVKQTVENFPSLSQTELAKTICEHLDWHAAGGSNRYQSGLTPIFSAFLTAA